MEYSAPQIAGRDAPFRSAIREHLKGHTQGLEDLAIEMLARGLSVRDIEDAFKDENGRLLLSKTAVSQLGERLWEDYQAADMTQGGRGAADWPGTEERFAARAMMGRIGEPEDIANAVVFLASPESGWITAQLLTVDGGRMDYIGRA